MAVDASFVGPTVRPAWATGACLAAHLDLETQFKFFRRRSLTPEQADAEYRRVTRALVAEDRIARRIEESYD